MINESNDKSIVSYEPYKVVEYIATPYGYDYELPNESSDQSTIDKNFKPKAKVPYKIVEYNQANSLKYFGSKDDYLKTKTGEIIIDTTNNKVIGFILVKYSNRNMGPLKVMKEYRGQGFGDLLFKDGVTKFRGKQLGVYKDNQVAIKIYKKYGFKEVEDKGDYIIMTLNGQPIQEACKDLNTARKFASEVKNLAKKYDANFYLVTDGASATNNDGSNEAVKHARDTMKEWETKHGFDAKEDWSKNIKEDKHYLYESINEKSLNDTIIKGGSY